MHPMHKSALEDEHIGKQKGFEWTVEITSTVCDALKKFRTGKNHYLLQQICDRLERESPCISCHITRDKDGQLQESSFYKLPQECASNDCWSGTNTNGKMSRHSQRT